MWPTKEDPQHGSFIEAHVRASKNLGNEIAVVILGEKPIDSWKEFIIYNASRKGPWGWIQKYKSVKSALKFLGGCDILHIHGGSWDTAYILIRLKFHFGKQIKFAVTEHQSHWFRRAPTGAKLTALISDLRSAVSPALKGKIEKFGSVRYIPNILQEPRFKNSPSKKIKTKRNFLFVGDIIDETKGISGILDAWKVHSLSFSEDILTLVGDGKDRKNLKVKYGLLENLIWKGRKGQSQVLEEMWSHDILIVNSKIETFSMVIGEALERGLKVISTPCIGPQSVYTDIDTLIFRKTFFSKELIELMKDIKTSYKPKKFDEFREESVSKRLENWYSS
jgi:glycosyltransferase involved in cell wall biosynthesis